MYFVSELRLSVVALMIIVPGAMFDISKNRFADVDTGVCQIINLTFPHDVQADIGSEPRSLPARRRVIDALSCRFNLTVR